MRAMILLGAACAVLLVTGCGGGAKYEHPEVSKAQLEKDNADCEWEASRATGNLPKDSDYKTRSEELFDKCMKAKGYNKK